MERCAEAVRKLIVIREAAKRDSVHFVQSVLGKQSPRAVARPAVFLGLVRDHGIEYYRDSGVLDEVLMLLTPNILANEGVAAQINFQCCEFLIRHLCNCVEPHVCHLLCKLVPLVLIHGDVLSFLGN